MIKKNLLILLILLIVNNSQALTNEEKSLTNKAITSATQGYDENFIELIEMLYGKQFLSQGGKGSVDQMIGALI